MKKILVVDDDLDILTLVKLTLTMKKFMVETVPRWQDVDDAIEKFKPDLILLDVSLGGADGRDICKRIKQAENTNHIPVLLFSANPEMGKSIKDCSANGFIAKPFELFDLVDTIKTNLVL